MLSENAEPVPAARLRSAMWAGARKKAVYALVAVAGAVLLLTLGRAGGQHIPTFVAWVESLGAWAPVSFVLGYALATLAFIPGSALTLAGGAVFGLVEGTLYSFLGATLGASGAFLVARYLARSHVERKLAGLPRFRQLDETIGEDGGKMVALLRLSPVVPFSLLNYSLGLTRVGFLSYLAASLAMLPGTLLYVYYGKVAGDLVAASGGQGRETLLDWIALLVGLAATVAVTVLITRKARRALARAEASHG